MRRHCLAVFRVLAGCHSPEFLLWQAEQEKYASRGGDSSGDPEDTTTGHAEPTSTGTPGSESTDAFDTTDNAPLSGSATEGPSEALGIVRDTFDRIVPAGYSTIDSESQVLITLIHG